MTDGFDLDAYLGRIGLDARPAADPAGLLALQTGQRRHIPFENLDIPLGRGISLAPDAVFDKLVTRWRGGYCFEQNSLFGRALTALGFTLRPLLARVWLMAEAVPPLTHTLNLVRIDGVDWIADAGFGGSFVPPMILADGSVAETPDSAAHRLSRDGEGWLLERAGNPSATDGRAADTRDWQRQYGFTLADVAPVDLEMGNHWTSTRPNTRFTTLKVASIVLPDGFAALTDRDLTVARGDVVEKREIVDAGDYRETVAGLFAIALTDDEIANLDLF